MFTPKRYSAMVDLFVASLAAVAGSVAAWRNPWYATNSNLLFEAFKNNTKKDLQ